MRFEIPQGFSLWSHGAYSIVLREDLDSSCCELVVELATKSVPRRGKIVVAPFPSVKGDKILSAFRRTVRGGPYDGLGFESTFGFVPRTLLELRVSVAAQKAGASVVSPLGCYWTWGVGGISYTGGYFTVFEEKAISLRTLLEKWSVVPPGRGQLRKVLSELAQALKKLHLAGVVHPDLTLRNVLIHPDQTCSFLDLDRAHAVSSVPLRSQYAVFSRLNRSLEKSGLQHLVPFRERAWFLRDYFGGVENRRRLVRRTIQHASCKLRLHRLFWDR